MNPKLLARMVEFGTSGLAIFGYYSSRYREYNYAYNQLSHYSKNNDRILDIGSTGSLFPLLLAKKGYNVHVLDTRKYHEKSAKITTKIGTISETGYQSNYFDSITCISVIEHIGMLLNDYDNMYGNQTYQKKIEYQRSLF